MHTDLKLSRHFRLSEFVRSDVAARRGLDNTPPQPVVDNLAVLCDELLEPIRERFGPVQITSGYRSREVNVAVGGSNASQHCKGEAADIVIPGRRPFEVCEIILEELDLPFHQLIHEFGGWVHISMAPDRVVPRRQCLTIDTIGSRPGLHEVRR